MSDIVPVTGRRAIRTVRAAPDPLDLSAELDASTSGTEFKGLREYLAMVGRHWFIFLVVVAVCTGYTVNNVRKERPVYRAKATVQLTDARRAIAGDMAATQNAQMPFSGSADPIQSQIQILLSDAVANVAVDESGLRLIPSFGYKFVPQITAIAVTENTAATSVGVTFGPTTFTITSRGQSASAPYGQPASVDGVSITVESRPPANVTSTKFDVVSRDAAVAHALSGFEVASRARTDILDLSSTGGDAEETRRIANAMAQAFQSYNTTSAQKFARRRRAFLESQLKQTDSILAAANNAYGSFKSSRLSQSAVAASQTKSLEDITSQRAQLTADKHNLESLLARAKNSNQSSAAISRALLSTPAVTGNSVVGQLAAQLAGYEKLRDDMVGAGAAPTNPDLVSVNRQIASTNGRIVEAVQSQLDNLDLRLEALDKVGASGAAQTTTAPQIEAREAQLGQEVATAEKLAGQLQEDLQKAKMAEAVEAGQVEIVQPARYPGYQMASAKKRKVMMGLLVGLMFGFGAAVLVDSLDRSIRRRADIESVLGVPGLVVIPRLGSSITTRQKMLRALPRTSGRPAALPDQTERDLVTVSDPRSPSAEAFRTLRTNLMFSQAVREMQILVVTSASPSEGKTVTAANLAVAFAQQGMRVLLIDCDLRRGRLHKVFSAGREPGFSDLILGYAEEEAVTHSTTIPGLYIISTGKIPPNPAELLGGDRAKAMIRELTEGYDLVILDTPPLLAASDAAILATLSDGVIMVLRAGATETTAAQQAMQQLQTIGARVVGAVLNDPESQVAKYGAYYNYDYSQTET